MRRRTFVSVAGLAGITALAGCSGDDTGSDDENGDGNGNGGETVDRLDIEPVDSYVQEMTVNGVTSVIEVHGDDMHYYEEGGDMEMYVVDDVEYIVFGNDCMVMGDEQQEESAEEPAYEPDTLSQDEGVSLEGTDTIDGEEVDVYAVDGTNGEAKYYVTDEGYIRRFEGEGQTIDFHSWGEVDPIAPPEANCEEPVVPGGE